MEDTVSDTMVEVLTGIHQARQVNTLASQQVKMQQHTMLLVNILIYQTVNEKTTNAFNGSNNASAFCDTSIFY
jgi:hypothetical protein